MIPKTPFSTSLSGSAKATERRIRSIFQGPKKRPPIWLMALSAAAILSCGGLVSCQSETVSNEESITIPRLELDQEPISVSDYLKQPEYFTREINGADTSFYRNEGDGWSIDVPSDWTPELLNLCWRAPGDNASFEVQPCTSSAQNIKAYWAEIGSWPYQTDMPAPFNEYYDGGIHEAQPDGTARYEYYFVPVSDDLSYTLVCRGVWGRTSETEWELLHTMLQSFTADESLHSVRAEPYIEGCFELEAALAGLADPQNPVWLNLTKDGYSYDRDGRSGAHAEQYASTLRAFEYTFAGRGNGDPTPEELRGRAEIYLDMSEIGSSLIFYEDSDYVYLCWRGAQYWFTAADPTQPGVSPYETAYAWFEEAKEID